MDKNRPPDKCIFGNQYWFDENGKFHNENGYSAEIFDDGSRFWYKHGVIHNDFGPAIIYSWGEKAWYIDGEKYTEQEFKQHKIKNFIDG